MQRFFMTFFLATLMGSAWASDDLSYLLNKVVLKMNAEKWVTTNSALVRVVVNAAVSDDGVEAVQRDVKKNLGKLSNTAEWHITSLQRSHDKSGLESLQITAKARLPQAQLAEIRTKTQAMSQPGEKYKVEAIEFTPSQAEIKEAKEALREDIYKQVQKEISKLNKLYPKQTYYVHEIDFLNYPEPIAQRSKMNRGAMMAMAVMPEAGPELDVGNKLTLNASVILGSMKTE